MYRFVARILGHRARLAERPVREIGACRGRLICTVVDHRRFDRTRRIGRQIARVRHGGEHHLLACNGPLVIARGRQRGRGLHQPRQHCRLRQRQPLGLAVEIMERGGAQAVNIVAEIGVGEIALQNLVLG